MKWKQGIGLMVLVLIGLPLVQSAWAQVPPPIEGVQTEGSSLASLGAELENNQIERYGDEDKPSYTDTYPGKLVPFVGMAVAVIIVWVVMAMVQNTDRYRHETIRSYLEKGVEVPYELLVDGGNPQTWKPSSDLRKAMVWLAVGLGIGMTGYIFSGNLKALALGLIFDFIGIGYLIVWKLEPTKVEEDVSA